MLSAFKPKYFTQSSHELLVIVAPEILIKYP